MDEDPPVPPDVPGNILGNVEVWADWSWPFPNREVFNQAIVEDKARKAADLGIEVASWRPDERVLELPVVRVKFPCWDETAWEQRGRCLNMIPTGPTRFGVLELTADDGCSFTALELYFKTCYGIARHLHKKKRSLLDHRFLEDLSLDRTSVTGVPTYMCFFGS